MLRSSKDHLAEVGETYFVHMRFALLVGVLAVGAGLACAVHAIIPGVCQHTCSRTVAALQQLFTDRSRAREAIADNSALLVSVAVAGISCASALVLIGRQ